MTERGTDFQWEIRNQKAISFLRSKIRSVAEAKKVKERKKDDFLWRSERKRKSLGKVHFLVENKAKKTDKRLLRDVEVPWEILLLLLQYTSKVNPVYGSFEAYL